MNKCFLLSVSLFTSIISSASFCAKSYPKGCEVTGFGYSQNYLVLNAEGKQTYYLIQNRTDKAIEIERHETREVFMSPKLKTKLTPYKWAAFASDVENIHLKCFTKSGENSAAVKCEDALDVCQYPRVKFALSNMGNYWVSADKPLDMIIKDSVKKGILLRW